MLGEVTRHKLHVYNHLKDAMAQHKSILVVEDEKDLAELLAYNLRREQYDVAVVHTGRQALEALAANPPDLLLLDVMLPELSGTEVASRVRMNPATASMPIIMLTAKTGEVDQIVGLTVGADDYVPKPFSMKVLMARIDAVLRRTSRTSTTEVKLLSIGPVQVNHDTHEAFLDGEVIKLTLTEFRLLSSLVQASGRVLSRAALMSKAMGPGVTVTERTIDVHVTSIRKKLGTRAAMLKTVRGVGYRITADLTEGEEEEAVAHH